MSDPVGLPFSFEMPRRPEQMILVAIDDDDKAWYEMIIPFILSLSQTDYEGRVGVIGYNLSSRKQAILGKAGIALLPNAGTGILACDRYLAAAGVMANEPELEALALYDADVWFPGRTLRLFDALSDQSSIHVAPDAHFCSFVIDPILPHAQELVGQCIEPILGRFGAALQAGMLLGGRVAWDDLGRHIAECLGRVGTDFAPIYGLDTTFLHLWAAKDRVRIVSNQFNFVPKWGVHERHDMHASGAMYLEHNGWPIEALHMTGDCRFNNTWRYYALNPVHALRDAPSLCLVDENSEPELSGSSFVNAEQYFASVGFKLVRLIAHHPVVGGSMFPLHGVSVQTWGSLEIELISQTALHAQFASTFLNNQPSALLSEVLVNGITALSRSPSFEVGLNLNEGARITLRSLSLPGQACQSIWDVRTTSKLELTSPH